jgi:LysR family glycine cleavage system transcriptional activator
LTEALRPGWPVRPAGRELTTKRLPSITALRAFESVARHMTCTRAAQELGVTAAAVSQQIRQLEDLTGVALFERIDRRLVPTEAALRCLPRVREGFAKLAEGLQDIADIGARQVLAVSVGPSFAVKWLLPRLAGFVAAAPRIELWLSTSSDRLELAQAGLDASISYGGGRFAGQPSELLLPLAAVPVCSPALLAGRPVRVPRDLGGHILVHEANQLEDPDCPSWPMWFAGQGITDVDATAGPRFFHPHLVIEAAVAGVGVALARSALVTHDLREGRLVELFPAASQGRAGYYLVRRKDGRNAAAVATFSAWLHREIARERAIPKGTTDGA